MRVLIIALTLVVFLAGLSVVFLPQLVNWNEYKEAFSQQIEDIAGRKSEVRGGIHLEIFPTPMIVLEDVRIQNRLDAKHENLLTFSRLEANLSLLDLIQGDLVMQNLQINNPVLHLDVLRDGTKAWEENEANVTGNVVDRLFDRVKFDDIEITNGTLTFYNGTSDKVYSLYSLNANLISQSAKGPFTIEGQGAIRNDIGGTTRDFPLDFNVTSGSVNDNGSMSLQMKLASEPLGMTSDFTGVIVTGAAFEIQGDLESRFEKATTILPDQLATRVKGADDAFHFSNYFSIKQGLISFTRLSGDWGARPFKGQIHVQEMENGQIYMDTDIHVESVSLKQDAFERNSMTSFVTDIFDSLPQGKGFFKIDQATIGDDETASLLFDYTTTPQGKHIKDMTIAFGDDVTVKTQGLYSGADNMTLEMGLKASSFIKADAFLTRYWPAYEGYGFVVAKDQESSAKGVDWVLNVDKNPDFWALKTQKFNVGDAALEWYYQAAYRETPAALTVKADNINMDVTGLDHVIQKLFASRNEANTDNGTHIVFDVGSVTWDGAQTGAIKGDISLTQDLLRIDMFDGKDIFGTDLAVAGIFDVNSVYQDMMLNGRIKTDDINNFTQKIDTLSGGVLETGLPIQGALSGEFDIQHRETNYDVTLSGQAYGGDWQISGQSQKADLSGDLHLTVRVKGDDIAALTAINGLEVGETLHGYAYDIFTTFIKNGDDIQAKNIKGSLAGSDVQGSVRVIGDRWNIDATTQKMDLSAVPTMLADLGKTVKDRVITGDINLKSKTATYKDVKAENVNAEMSLSPADWNINKMVMSIDGAPLNASGRISWDGDMAFDVNASDIDYSTLSIDLPITARRMDIDFALKGRVDAWEGQGDVSLKNGELTSFDVQNISAGLLGIEGPVNVDALLKESFSQGATPYALASMTLALKEGVFTLNNIDIAGEFGKIYGDGGRWVQGNEGAGEYSIPLEFSLVSPAGIPSFEAVIKQNGNTEFKAEDLKTFANQKIQDSFKQRIQQDQQGSAVDGILQRLNENEPKEDGEAVSP